MRRRAVWIALALAACAARAPAPAPPDPPPQADDAWTAELARKPSAADHATMRARFREARGVEEKDPTRAVALYEESWKAEPTVPAALGIARAARARRDDTLARRWLARARRLAEHDTGHSARLATAPSREDGGLRLLAVDDEVATFGNGTRMVFRERLADGAFDVAATMPDGVLVRTGSRHYAIAEFAGGGDAPPRLLELGVDDWDTAREVPALAASDQWVISPDEKIVVGSKWGGPIEVVDRATGARIASVASRGGEGVVGFLADGSFAVDGSGAAGTSRKPEVDPAGGPCIVAPPAWSACTPVEGLGAAAGATLSAAAGHFLALRTNGAFYVFDLAKHAVAAKLEGHFQTVTRLSVAPDGRTLVSLSPTRVYLWDLARRARVFVVGLGSDDTPAYTPDGTRLVSGGWVDTKVFDATPPDFRPLVEQSYFERGAHVAFGASGSLWIAGAHGVARIGGDGTFRAYRAPASYALAVSPDERWFATASSFGYPSVHDARTGELVPRDDQEHRRLLDAVIAPARDSIVSPDGMTVATSERGGVISVAFDLHDPTTVQCGPVACVVTDPDGNETVLGDASSVQCNVGALWLPAEACAADDSG